MAGNFIGYPPFLFYCTNSIVDIEYMFIKKMFIGVMLMSVLMLTGCMSAPTGNSQTDFMTTEVTVADLSNIVLDGKNSAYVEDSNLFVVLYGSSSCKPLVENPRLDSGFTLNVDVVEHDTQMCTFDYVPAVTKITTESSFDDVTFVKVSSDTEGEFTIPIIFK